MIRFSEIFSNEEIIVSLTRHLSWSHYHVGQVPGTCEVPSTFEYGSGFSHRNLFNMIRFAEVFPDEKIVHALSDQLTWTHFRGIIYIDDSWKQDMSNNQIVYSTEHGRMCSSCGQPVAECACHKQPKKAVQDGIVRVRREVKGRRGKTVTTITGIPFTDNELQELASELKRQIGTGGSVKDGVIIIQGDHRELITSILSDKGFKMKRAGG